MTFESEGLLIVAICIWLLPASYVVFLKTLVIFHKTLTRGFQIQNKIIVRIQDVKLDTFKDIQIYQKCPPFLDIAVCLLHVFRAILDLYINTDTRL